MYKQDIKGEMGNKEVVMVSGQSAKQTKKMLRRQVEKKKVKNNEKSIKNLLNFFCTFILANKSLQVKVLNAYFEVCFLRWPFSYIRISQNLLQSSH